MGIDTDDEVTGAGRSRGRLWARLGDGALKTKTKNSSSTLVSVIEPQTDYERALLMAVECGYACIFDWITVLGMSYDEGMVVFKRMKSEGLLESTNWTTWARLQGYEQ